MPPARRLLPIGLLLVLATSATSSAQEPPQPGGSATIAAGPSMDSGVGEAEVHWTALCPNPSSTSGNIWSVSLNAYHQDGSHAAFNSTAESGVESDTRDQTLLLEMAPGLRTETFSVTVVLTCSPNPDVLIGSGSVTVLRKKGGGSGGGGDGGGDGGGGGGGSGGGAGGAAPDDPLRPGGCQHELRGSAGPDVIDGSSEGDLVLALAGADRVRGRDGDDCLVGDSGDDRLLGDGGFDRLTGGGGADRLDGGPGRNAYDAGPGDDRVVARNGLPETVRCGPGEDTVHADADDHLHGCEHIHTG